MNGINERFSELYDRNVRKIYGLAYRICGNREDAQDIVQNTFLQAYEKYDSFRGESSEFTWLYAISKNLCRKLLQSKKRSSYSALKNLMINADSIAVEDSIGREEMRDLAEQVKEGCLLGLVRCLPFYQRTAFVLHTIMELSIPDTAQVLDKSAGATRTLISRAKKSLKDFLCNNCSLYDPDNPCRCENLIGFSLKQNWIQRRESSLISQNSELKYQIIENDIYDTEKLVCLYRSLPDADYKKEMKRLVFSGDKIIFSDKKVK